MLEGQGQMEAQYKVSCEYTPVPVGHDGLFSQFGTVRKGPVGLLVTCRKYCGGGTMRFEEFDLSQDLSQS
jgi:hypothetical protein